MSLFRLIAAESNTEQDEEGRAREWLVKEITQQHWGRAVALPALSCEGLRVSLLADQLEFQVLGSESDLCTVSTFSDRA